MNWRRITATAALTLACATLQAQSDSYLGFDRNEYPGDDNLKTLRQTFSYSGYWLNNPPGEKTNTWAGHRMATESAGFGFLVLFNGRLYAELKSVPNAARIGRSDAQTAASAARREGFPLATVIFLDQEQGGRMLPEQKVYIYAWMALPAPDSGPGFIARAWPPPMTATSLPQKIFVRAQEGARSYIG